MGIEPPERAKYIRVIMAELSRIQSHIIWFGAFCLGTGFDTGFKLAFGYRDYILDLFEAVTGGRVYPAGYICPGGVRRDLPQGLEKRILEVLDKTEKMLEVEALENPGLVPSRVYRLLNGHNTLAVTAGLLSTRSSLVRRYIRLYQDRLRYVRASLTGNDLAIMGVSPGPRIKEVLSRLHEARLDGKVTSKQGEEEMVRGWLA